MSTSNPRGTIPFIAAPQPPSQATQPSRPAAPTRDDIRNARGGARLTQLQAANLIGASLSAWESWESGARNMPPAKLTLFKLLTEN